MHYVPELHLNSTTRLIMGVRRATSRARHSGVLFERSAGFTPWGTPANRTQNHLVEIGVHLGEHHVAEVFISVLHLVVH